METILKQDKSKSNKEFEKLLSEDLGNRKFKEGEITTGIIEEIGKPFFYFIFRVQALLVDIQKLGVVPGAMRTAAGAPH